MFNSNLELRNFAVVLNFPSYLALLRKVLVENPSKRATIKVVRDQQWCKKKFNKQLGKKRHN